ncbi:16S rRNA processing protein RimM [Campylobacter sp. FMV-PI01]|uniref:Ribosome maturation factor RimM n=1 Tax=Campylobacter portucalensis TaxID=2608384 RepID=A0A6L5WGJ0_9BACT|nr:ribosome maturation factor RimM [Campylobacter portucalensis]MSN96099.1 16S rRNA processing protein RimM [Campylobacter portucalensis]
MNSLLEVAILGKTVGLKGALKLHNKSDFPSQFKKGAKFFLKNGNVIEILKFKENLVVFKDYEDIDLAKNLVNEKLFQSIENTKKICKLKKDEFFYFDIIGMKIIENGKILGKVSDIFEVGSSYLFEIKTDENLVKDGFNKVFYVPYVDKYVKKICLEDKKIESNHAFLILQES